MSLGLRLESLRGNMAIGDFARLFGIHKNTYSNYVKRQSVPDANFITAVCRKFQVSPNWLLMGIGPKAMREGAEEGPREQVDTEVSEHVLIPLIETWITDSEGEIIHDGILEHIPFRRRWMERFGDAEDEFKYCILTRVRKDSMSPTIIPGDLVLLDTSRECRTHTRTGDIFMVRLPDGERALKRVAMCDQSEESKVVFFCDNAVSYRPIELEVDSIEALHRFLLGRVLWICREF